MLRPPEIPDIPGVYLFKDKNGKVIYVGKAKSLKKRILSHFSDAKGKSSLIVSNAHSLDFIPVRNESEALALEAELIKTHLPKFNVLMKDDKSYPFVVITKDEFPAVRVLRGKPEGLKVVGPFIPPKNARAIAELVESVFKLRSCANLRKRRSPCMKYHLGKCSAPCSLKVSREEYLRQVKQAISLLSGNVSELISSLIEKIEELADKEEFETAASLRDRFYALKSLLGKRVFDKLKDFSIYRLTQILPGVFEGDRLVVKNGVLTVKETQKFFPTESWDEDSVREIKDEAKLLEAVGSVWVKETWDGKGSLFLNFKPLIKVKYSEIPPYLEHLLPPEPILTEEFKRAFEETFGLKAPFRAEAFDASTASGRFNVVSCVVWEGGKMRKEQYRRYKVGFEGVNDYRALQEALKRRFKKIASREIPSPNLLLVDGGLGQLSVAVKVKRDFNLKFPIFALAKKDETLYTEDGLVVKIKEIPVLYKFFGTLRDEAHRFAITFNRKLRQKETLKSVFEQVKGIGPKRRLILERMFDDLRELSYASADELVKLGIPKKVALEVLKKAKEVFEG